MKYVLLILLATLLLCSFGMGQIPQLMSHQGFIADSTGTSITGTLPMTFRFFNDSSTGTSIMTQSFQSVSLNKGVFNVNIDVSSLSFMNQYWLETEVNGQTLTPRTRLTSSPYSLRSVVSDSTATIGDESITSAKIANGTIQRVDVATTFKAPFSDTSDYTRRTVVSDSTLAVSDGSITSAKIANGTIQRIDVATTFKSPYSDTSDYSRRTIVSDSTLAVSDGSITSARIANGTIQRIDVATTFKSPYSDTSDYSRRTAVADSSLKVTDGSITSTKITNGTIQRVDVQSTFKAPYADTADYARNTGTANPWVTNGSTISYSNGNVAIGVSTTTNKLHINGGASTTTRVQINNNNATTGLLLGQDNNADYSMWNAENGYLRFGTNNLERMRITSSGRVGIGTTNPLSALHVYGDFSNSGAGGILLDASAGNTDLYTLRINPFVIGTGSVGYQFQTKSSVGGTQVPFTLDNWGRVGVRCTTPLSVLQVNGDYTNNGAGGIMLDAGGGNDVFSLRINPYSPGGTAVGYQFQTKSTTGGTQIPFTLDPWGKVGIRTTNPLSALHVNGDYYNNGDGGILLDASTGQGTDVYSLRINPFIVGNASVGYQFQTKSSVGGTQVPLTLDNWGRVGIGTNHPQSLLAVAGTITAKQVDVTLTGWSDFVFADDYKLPSLEKVEQHIKEFKHLPDVPSEQEVLSKPVNIGKMQSILLQKIEELTLYVIELKKKNDALEKIVMSGKH